MVNVSRLLALRLYHVRRLVDAEPLRHVLHRVGVGSTAVVADVDSEFVVVAVIPQGGFVGLPLPAQRVAVDEEGHGIRRCHVVAVQVGNVVDGDVDLSLVDAAVQLVDVHQQLVVASHIAEVQVAQFLVGLYRSTDVLVNVLTDEVAGCRRTRCRAYRFPCRPGRSVSSGSARRDAARCRRSSAAPGGRSSDR